MDYLVVAVGVGEGARRERTDAARRIEVLSDSIAEEGGGGCPSVGIEQMCDGLGGAQRNVVASSRIPSER